MKTHRGYVLLVVLIVLTMAATLLVAVGQLAVGQARSAATAEADLQRKWAVFSARQATLPHVEAFLAQAEAAATAPVARLDCTMQLGDLSLAIALCDEQAKANVNQLLERGDDLIVADRLRAEWNGSGVGNTVHLRPLIDLPPDPGRLGPPRLIRSFGQIFDGISPDQLFSRQGVSQQVTCFSAGAINLLRADEPAMRLALSPSLTRIEIHRLVEERDKRWRATRPSPTGQTSANVGDAAQSLLEAAKISPRDRGQLAITDRSTCHGVWIVVKDRRRVWYNWFVLDESMPRQLLRSEFRW